MKNSEEQDAGNGEVNVKIIKVQPAPRWLTRLNCEQQTGLPPVKFYGACSRWGVKVAHVGQLRVVDAQEFAAAQQSNAKPIERKPRGIDMSDADALKRAGLRVVKAGAK